MPWWRDRHLLLPIASAALLAVGYALDWSGVDLPATIVLAASLLAGAATFVPGAVKRLLRRRVGVGLLMTIAAAGAVLLGHVGEAAALAFLFSIAEALEDRAMDKARTGLRALLSLIPETATVSKLSGEVTMPVDELRELDILVIRPGDRVATDGIVVSGRSSIDNSAITGESIPVEVGPGDHVPAGSINGGGSMQLEATADGRDNSLTKIVELVEQASARKGERARLADRIARPLVPAVLILAGMIVIFGFIVGDPLLWTERALVVLVAASPCALAIAVPVTVISAIGAASRFGVVIKSGAAFEQLGAVELVAFDKTGTLTRGRPEVVAVEAVEEGQRDRVLAIAAGLESHSTHPLAAAIVTASADPAPVVEVTEEPGRGITGSLDGQAVRVGSPRWISPGAFSDRAASFEEQGMTVVVVEFGGEVVGILGIRDELKPEAADTIRRLAAVGIDTAMLTGDNTRTAAALARQAGITDVHAELLPGDKASAIETYSATRRTAMIGDGINDAPALAAADVGIAMGVSGSDAAIESASVAFTGNDLRLIPAALLHARRGRQIMTGNIVLSLGIIVVLFPLALLGVLGLAGVVLVHEIAEVVVILNGSRAARRPQSLQA
ncbi:heavy metal-translocating P-type ATPase Cd/Co/Hg/Pb/Zn-transporting [Pseudolysinimonas yzui]|uniref:Heavy metal-translocating P-type ATPase Cd/Co/Hg/Pb/Zn-transporting n=1 Tax=Pseudolysinimonas yzui TaxID=2708254 RepID=A0A8J3GPV2_9MICO|nr:cation-translocating P-type ATPase [Pseudolysinimonas yzui]GHF12610.1 heavy metal-translocating P-type ATPase Cd/Co/Hg/Pb/Zn-transporting [Pseudolysinimonas yzui]